MHHRSSRSSVYQSIDFIILIHPASGAAGNIERQFRLHRGFRPGSSRRAPADTGNPSPHRSVLQALMAQLFLQAGEVYAASRNNRWRQKTGTVLSACHTPRQVL
jgi:hypothetical protein